MSAPKDSVLPEGIPGVEGKDAWLALETLLEHFITPSSATLKRIPVSVVGTMLILGAFPFAAGTLACFYYLWPVVLPGTPVPDGFVTTATAMFVQAWHWFLFFHVALIAGLWGLTPTLKRHVGRAPSQNCFVYLYALALVVLSVITGTILLLQLTIIALDFFQLQAAYWWLGGVLLSFGMVGAMVALARRHAANVVEAAQAVGTLRGLRMTRTIRLVTIAFTGAAMLSMLAVSAHFVNSQQDVSNDRQIKHIVARSSPIRAYFTKCGVVGETFACVLAVRAEKFQDFTVYGEWLMEQAAPAIGAVKTDTRLSWSVAEHTSQLVARFEIKGEGDQDVELRAPLKDVCRFPALAPPFNGLSLGAVGKVRDVDVPPGQNVEFLPSALKVFFDQRKRSCAS
jgi:hypothetical protein